MVKKVLIFTIRIYQKFISPIKRPCCRFYPTCSDYSINAIKKYGFFKSTLKIFKRLAKCHPFHPGGYDPVE